MDGIDNPWEKIAVRTKGEQYNQLKNDFSWVLKNDRDYLTLADSTKQKRSDKSVDWGIPNQIVGNPETAQFFLCLLNPQTNTDTSVFNDDEPSLTKYCQQEAEWCQDPEDYYDCIIDEKHNILEREITDFYHGYFFKNQVTPMIINNRIEHIVERIKAIWRENYGDYKKNTGPKVNNDLNVDFVELCHKKLLQFFEQYVLDVKAGKKGSFSRKQFDSNFDQDVLEELSSWKAEELDSKCRQLSHALDPFKNQYFLFNYYWHILTDDEDRVTYFEQLYNEKNLTKKFHDYRICNLELLPYRTNKADGIRLKPHARYGYLASANFAARVILKKIVTAAPEQDLFFVFRSYGNWKSAIDQAIVDLQRNGRKDWEIKAGKLNSNEIAQKYFYGFPNANTSLSRNNLRRIVDGKITNSPIDQDVYERMKQAIRK